VAERLRQTQLQETPAGQTEEEAEPAATPQTVEGRGEILAFVNESCGLALWERQGHSEQVYFERHNCYWMGTRMDTLDLEDCYNAGDRVSFSCEPAPADQPYQWVATHLQQVDD